MARADHEVKVRLTAKDEASPTIAKAESRVGKLTSSIKVGAVAAAAAATAAFYALGKALGSAIGAAQKQEDAVKKLDAALMGLGPSADAVSAALQKQASELQKTTRYGDEAIISAQALLATMGVTPDKMELATRATTDLAAAFGISLDQAARNIGKTMGGFAGELGELIPELKSLDAEALKSGAGVELLASKFAGRAQADVQTFSGRVAQLSNAFGDLQERVGFALTENESLTTALGKLRDILTSGGLVDAVAALAEGISTATSRTIDFGTAIVETVGGLRLWLASLTEGIATQQQFSQATLDNLKQLEEWQDPVVRLWSAITDKLRENYRESQAAEQATAKLREENEKLAETFKREVLAILDANNGVKSLTQSFKDLAEAQGRTIADSDEFIAELESLGVTLEANANQALARHNLLLEEADRLYRQGLITPRDYANIERAVSEATSDAADSIEHHNEVLGRTSVSYDQATQAASRYAASVREVNQASAEGAASGGGGLTGGSIPSSGLILPYMWTVPAGTTRGDLKKLFTFGNTRYGFATNPDGTRSYRRLTSAEAQNARLWS